MIIIQLQKNFLIYEILSPPVCKGDKATQGYCNYGLYQINTTGTGGIQASSWRRLS